MKGLPERIEGLVKPTPLAQGTLVGLVFMAWPSRARGGARVVATPEPGARSPEPPARGRP